YDSRGLPMVIPALAVAGASLDARSDEADDLLAGLELLDTATGGPLNGADQATRLAAVIARTRLDAGDAPGAAVGGPAIVPILTLDAAKWQQPSADLDEPLHIIEIADTGEQGPGSGAGFSG